MTSCDSDAKRHFDATIGGIPDSVALLRRLAPGAFAAYLAARADIYRTGELDPAARELVFLVLDVVAAHEGGAKAHAAAGMKVGLTPGMIMEALAIAILVHGHHTWANTGAAVMRYVEELASAP